MGKPASLKHLSSPEPQSNVKALQTQMVMNSVPSSSSQVPTVCSSDESGTESSDESFSMASLSQQLPIRRGLSKYYEGMSRSFSSLLEVKNIADLAKPEHTYNRKLRMKRRLKKSLNPACSHVLDSSTQKAC